MPTWEIKDKKEIEKFADLIKDHIINSAQITASNSFAGDIASPSKRYNCYRLSVGFTPDAFKTLNEAMERPFIMIFFDKCKEDPKDTKKPELKESHK